MALETDQAMEDIILQPFRRATFAVVVFIVGVVFWASTAQLATTVHVSGTLTSSQPQYELQHSYGGKLRDVFVEQHDHLEESQPVFAMDVSLQTKNLKQVNQQIELLTNENKVLDAFLTKPSLPKQLEQLSDSTIFKYYKSKHAQLVSNVENSSKAAQSLFEQLKLKINSLKHLEAREKTTRSRLHGIDALAAKGVVTVALKEDHADRLMTLSSQINEANADITALKDQLRQTRLKQNQYSTEFHLELQRKRVANQQALPDLYRRALELKDEISNAIIRSPISGSVMELNYATKQMQVPKGATLAIIAQELVDPVVHVTIPTSAIDQVTTGMSGVLTLSSLPQRNLSRVNAELVAISPDVSFDPSGMPIGYKAIAKINQEQLSHALSTSNVNMHLSSGMPASLALEGRKMTFSQYLVAPFFKIFEGALQD